MKSIISLEKDILNFHALFWPALLHTAEFKKPTNVFVHGFLTLNGNKMSKSKGNFLWRTNTQQN